MPAVITVCRRCHLDYVDMPHSLTGCSIPTQLGHGSTCKDAVDCQSSTATAACGFVSRLRSDPLGYGDAGVNGANHERADGDAYACRERSEPRLTSGTRRLTAMPWSGKKAAKPRKQFPVKTSHHVKP